MAIPKGHKTNFETLQRASDNGDLALMECTDRETGEPVYVVCAVYRDEQGFYNTVPMARMFDGNPYEQLRPPTDEAT